MRHSIFLVAFLLIGGPLAAQQPAPQVGMEELVDRVVAIVGDTVLLYSDVEAEIEQLRAVGQVPQDPAQFELFAQQILESKVSDLMLVSAAREAGLTVFDEQVDDQVEQQIRTVRQQFPTETEFLRALSESGLTLAQYRQSLMARARDGMLIEQYVSTRLRNRARPVIDEIEIQAFFDAQGGTLGERPATVSFRQVVVAPRFSEEARQAAIAQAREVLEELRGGADFAVLARRFSDDPGSREHGGDLGWFRNDGQMVQEFSRAAFGLRAGQTSGIVETEFGFHIIRVDRVRGPERQARHILIRPEMTPGDIEIARVRADSVAQAVRGGASLATLASRYNTPEDIASVPRVPMDRLPPDYTAAVADANVGDLIGPVRIEDPRGTRWAVIRLTERTEAGPITLEDVRDQIRTHLQQQKMMEQVLRDLQDQVYVSLQI
jgi:peptidyl-prolyl cis-trans isomerase SurA